MDTVVAIKPRQVRRYKNSTILTDSVAAECRSAVLYSDKAIEKLLYPKRLQWDFVGFSRKRKAILGISAGDRRDVGGK